LESGDWRSEIIELGDRDQRRVEIAKSGDSEEWR
jgi:hypothetical protein